MAQFTDRELTCVDCGQEFTFTAGEQEYHAQRGFEHDPKRCSSCRAARKKARGGSSETGGGRELHEAVCAGCGETARVPFKPTGRRPVYCSRCFEKERT